ncbi:MAG: hypothetical protein HY238_20965, partial [Acidobacteria bacterium]|nr:hypothetical protein [Acidobacteriota bacterium]
VNGRGDLGTVSFTLQTALNLPTFSDTVFGDMQQGGAGQTLPTPLIVQLTNSFGPVGLIGVYWKVIEGPAGEGSAVLDPRVSLSDGAGFARTTVTLGPVASRQPIRIRATVPGISGGVTFTVFATGGPPAEVRILQGDGCPGATPTTCNQPGAPGATLPTALRVRVLDLLGNPVPLPNAQYPLLFNVDPPEAAQIQNFFQQADWEASVLVKLGNTPGPFKVIATAGNGIATFNLRIVSNASAVVVLSGNNQRVNAGATSGPITLRVNDSLGNAVPGTPLTITAPSTVTLVPAQGAPGNPLTLTTGSDGRVTFSARVGAGTAVGQFTITAGFNVDGRTGSTTVSMSVGGQTPVFTSASVVNAGSFIPGLTPYGLGTAFGTGFSSVTGIEFPGGATAYKGTVLRIDGQAMPLYLVRNESGQEQINFQARSDLVAGTTVTVEIENSGSRSSVQVFVLRVQPGIFEYIPQGSTLKYAAALKTDGTVVGPNNPVPRGGFFSAFFTGGGITLPILQAGQPGPVSPLATTFIQPVAGIADQGAAVSFSGVAPGLVIYQVNVQVPLDAPIGPNVKFSIVMQGAPSQDSRIAVGPAQ